MTAILPSGGPPADAEADRPPWSREHQRLHRHLLHEPKLLPEGATLLLAVSGGQDSMALLQLLRDLSRLHRWQLHLWHGDHGWHAGAAATARSLAAWVTGSGGTLLIDRADHRRGQAIGEAGARQWRYDTLLQRARDLGCSHVVTGHTASDRAETMLINLARGAHRRGLASLRASRQLQERILVRPLLIFSRAETLAITQAWKLPIWSDPSNEDKCLERNRLRLEVMPTLDRLHPGVERRLAAQAQRLADDDDSNAELIDLALLTLLQPDNSLNRPRLVGLARANQRRLLQAWLERLQGPILKASALNALLPHLADPSRCGSMDLAGDWRLHWRGDALTLISTPSPQAPDAQR